MLNVHVRCVSLVFAPQRSLKVNFSPRRILVGPDIAEQTKVPKMSFRSINDVFIMKLKLQELAEGIYLLDESNCKYGPVNHDIQKVIGHK